MKKEYNAKTKLDILLKEGVVNVVKVSWGRGFRNVVVIDGKKYQYSGKSISKILQKKFIDKYRHGGRIV